MLSRFLIIPIYICTFSFSLRGQEIEITSAFDSSRIYIGDQINYTVTVERPLSILLSMPRLRDSLVKGIEILKGPISDTSVLNNGRIRIVQKYLITSFDSGFYNVPPVFVEISNSSGIKRYYSDYNPLEVMRVKISPPDTAAGIFDIIGPYKVPLTIWEIMPWILGAALLIVLGYFGYLVYRNYMKKGDLGPEEIISEPAHIIAFRELEKLLQEKLWQDGQVKLYYTRLTEIIRQYLDNRFGISSLELTTSETLHELKKSGFREEESFGMLKKILSAADLVKFAKYKPHPDENEVIFTLSWDFVQSTRLEIKVDENVSSEQSGGEE